MHRICLWLLQLFPTRVLRGLRFEREVAAFPGPAISAADDRWIRSM